MPLTRLSASRKLEKWAGRTVEPMLIALASSALVTGAPVCVCTIAP